MKLENRKISELKPMKDNPRKISDEQLKMLEKSIDKFGYIEPIVWNRKTGNVISGHQRLKVLMSKGVKEVEVVSIELDESQEKALNLAMNKISGDWDFSKLNNILKELKKIDEELFELTGFDEIEILNFNQNIKDIDYILEDNELNRKINRDEVITIGKHKIIYGKKTKKNIKLLFGDEKPAFSIIQNSIFPIDKYDKNKKDKHIVMFSGGKDSTAMLLLMLKHKQHIDEVIYFSMGEWEYPEVKKHIEKIKKLPINFTELSYKNVSQTCSSRSLNKDIQRWGFASPIIRWCSGAKDKTIEKYLRDNYKDYNIIRYYGFAKNELNRALKKTINLQNIRTPLIEYGLTEHQALQYCYEHGYDWDGLYEALPHKRLGCWACPLQNQQSFKFLYEHRPELFLKLCRLQMLSKTPFRMGGDTVFSLADKLWREKFGYIESKKNNQLRNKSGEVYKELSKRLTEVTSKNDIIFDNCETDGEVIAFLCKSLNRRYYGIKNELDEVKKVIKVLGGLDGK